MNDVTEAMLNSIPIFVILGFVAVALLKVSLKIPIVADALASIGNFFINMLYSAFGIFRYIMGE